MWPIVAASRIRSMTATVNTWTKRNDGSAGKKTKNSQKWNSISVECVRSFPIYLFLMKCENEPETHHKKYIYWKIWMRKLIETHPATICSWSIFIALYCFIASCVCVYSMAVRVGCQQKPTPKSNFSVMRRQCPRDVEYVCAFVERLPAQMFMLWNWRMQERKKTRPARPTESKNGKKSLG